MPPYFPGKPSKASLEKRFESISKIGMVFRSYSKVADKEKFYVIIGVSFDSVLVRRSKRIIQAIRAWWTSGRFWQKNYSGKSKK